MWVRCDEWVSEWVNIRVRMRMRMRMDGKRWMERYKIHFNIFSCIFFLFVVYLWLMWHCYRVSLFLMKSLTKYSFFNNFVFSINIRSINYSLINTVWREKLKTIVNYFNNILKKHKSKQNYIIFIISFHRNSGEYFVTPNTKFEFLNKKAEEDKENDLITVFIYWFCLNCILT